jgi:hypothetical protein
MNPKLPNAKSARPGDDHGKIKRLITQRALCGLANDTKWDEFIDAMRAHEGWRPSYRCKCVDGSPSYWDAEWFYHLPFPMISVEWLDIAFIVEERKNWLVAPKVTDQSEWIEEVLKKVGLEYRKGRSMIRIFGYSPRSTDLFDA